MQLKARRGPIMSLVMEVVPVVFALLFGVALVYLLFSRQRSDYGKHVQQLQPKKQRVKPEPQIFTRAEVAKHKSRHDAWVIIKHKASGENRVYDVTEYVDEHPGGESILSNVGGEATEGFHGPQHPDTVFVMVEEFHIGKVLD